ncbi:MAG TPA: MFS transporter [Acidiphilium sp.]
MAASDDLIHRDSAAFRRASLAMFLGGFGTCAMMYCVQPLLPLFAGDFAVSPTVSSLALSLTTFALAFGLLAASALSEAWSRKTIMAGSVIVSAVLTLMSAAIPHWGAFLAVRALIGLTLSGLPAVAMAWLAEEMNPKAMGLAMGLYIGGNGIGGMVGRLLTGILAGVLDWRWTVAAAALVGLGCGIAFVALLPPSRHFSRRPLAFGGLARNYLAHLADPALRLLFAEAFIVVGAFATAYNYITFRLLGPPYHLPQAATGLIFVIYLIGAASSTWTGHLAGRFGRDRLLPIAIGIELAGALLSLATPLPAVVLGIVVLTIGFFASHTTASAWVSAEATRARAQAAALYLFLFYLGSSIVGSVGGIAWSRGGWGGVIALIGVLLLIGLASARRLMTLPSRVAKVM